MIITLIIMTISGNLVLSLGMVGALSIVRFRTPIKDPVDLVFIFWAITVGIANGVGYFNISIIGSLFITIVLFIMSRQKEDDEIYLLILHTKRDVDETILFKKIKSFTSDLNLKSKTITKTYTEIILEVRLDTEANPKINSFLKDETIIKSTLITYEGELKNT
jgi:uncharacterized membrane protein YhiD involved in acid resistance